MNIAEYSIRKKVITIVLTVFVCLAGIGSYFKLPRLEDPEFTIKQALVITRYPGASAEEVASEVSDRIEKAVQQMGQLKRVTSESRRGLSTVTVEIKDKFDKHSMPQVWDELRRKINDVQSQLPNGAEKSTVIDDYGDVYGLFYAVYGDGYSYAELKDCVKFLQRELLHAKDVKKIELWGVQEEVIYIQISREKMAALGISPENINTVLSAKNIVADAGRIKSGPEFISVTPTGGVTTVEGLGDIIISKNGERLITLKDIADIKRSYEDPPQEIMRFNGHPAIGLGISTVLGGNVVEMGDAVKAMLEQLKLQLPAGIQVEAISMQSDTVKSSVNDFILNVIESVIIVIIVLLFFMGFRSGMLIGFVLIVTVAATMLVMKFFDITLERISLGALIIALGMLVDNAIVITEGIMVKIHKGVDRLRAASETVEQTKWPLLNATMISIIAFASIGLSEHATGEFCISLFYVILISLGMSWITAVTLTPLLCFYAFNSKKLSVDHEHDPYDAFLFRAYKKSLELCLRWKWIFCLVMFLLLVASVIGFGFVKQSFFPSSARPQFMIDVWMPEGTHISETSKKLSEVEEYIKSIPHVKGASSFVGSGTLRFILTYAPEKQNSSYGMLLVDVDDWTAIEEIVQKIQNHYDANDPDCMVNTKKFLLGPGDGGKIQARFSGPDYAVLLDIAEKAKTLMRSSPDAKAVHSDWAEKVKTIKPVFSESKAGKLGITYQDLALAIKESYEGVRIGSFREGDELLSIIARAPELSRNNVENIENSFIWNPIAGRMIPMGQCIDGITISSENPKIMRRDRSPTVTIHCDQREGLASELFNKLSPQLEKIPLPEGYKLEWGGEHEDTIDAQGGATGSIPLFAVFMVLMVVLLFNSIRHPLIIWLTVPLALIGVTAGLLLCNQPFGFMALLGFMSLSGMQIKNAIVLIDEINVQIDGGKARFTALLDSAVSRIRPVSMAAFTTVLGMLPLLTDAFFAAMSVTIMFGLAFACILTLYVVPVLYCIFYRIRYAEI